MKKTFFWSALFALLFSFALSSFAQPNSQRKGKNHDKQKPNPEMQNEIRQYLKTNVSPVLRQQRAKLERQIAPADKAIIDQTRQARRQAAPEMREMRQQRQQGEKLSDEQRENFKNMKEKRKGIMEQLRPIADKYNASIDQLMNEIAPQQQKWETDLRQIASKYISADKLAKWDEHKGKLGKNKNIQFLLINPNDKDADIDWFDRQVPHAPHSQEKN